MITKELKYFSMFTGIGGFEYGLNKSFNRLATEKHSETEGLRQPGNQSLSDIGDGNGRWSNPICVGYSEIDKYADAIYKYQFCYKNKDKGEEGCYVNTVEKNESSIKGITQSAKNVSKNIKGNGEQTTENKVEKQAENTTPLGDKKSSICMEEDVLAVESQKKSSLRLSTEMGMDIEIENDTEEDICINLHLKKPTTKNTKSSVTTATTQKGDMGNAHTKEEQNEPINFGDATKINERELPDFDLLVGGFPCQAFSIAGKRAGFDDTRGTLFFDVARILKHKRPRHFILENVKGLLSHDSGQTFQTILKVLSDIGYRVEWQILNSKYFGVPQNRERVYIVGHLRGECGCQVFPIRKSNGENLKQIVGGSQGNRVYSTDGVATTQASEGGRGAKTGLYQVSKTIRTVCRGSGKFGPSLEIIKDKAKIRRLTPTECERIQGFPDGWTAKGILDGEEVDISDTQRYKTLGNAVTTNVVSAVVERLYDN